MSFRGIFSRWAGLAVAAGLALPCAAQVLIVRGDGGERAVAIAGGFVQGAIGADVPGLDYDQLVWGGSDASHAAAIEAVKAKRARLVFTDNAAAAREMLRAIPELKVVLAGSDRLADNQLEPGGRMSLVLPLPAPENFIRVATKNFRLRKLVAPFLQDRGLGLPNSYTGDKRLAVTPVPLNSAESLGPLSDALAAADGVLLVPGALPPRRETAEAILQLAAARKLPVIALSPEWVSYGATAAIYADTGDVGNSASAQVMGLLAGGGQTTFVNLTSIAVRKGAAAKAGFDLKGLTITRSYE